MAKFKVGDAIVLNKPDRRAIPRIILGIQDIEYYTLEIQNKYKSTYEMDIGYVDLTYRLFEEFGTPLYKLMSETEEDEDIDDV